MRQSYKQIEKYSGEPFTRDWVKVIKTLRIFRQKHPITPRNICGFRYCHGKKSHWDLFSQYTVDKILANLEPF